MTAPRSYSQNDEEEMILAYFYRFGTAGPGRFLDIGAHDGHHLSNTWRLSELGWGGTLVEPSPAPFCNLMLNYKDRPNVNLVNVAIVPEQSKLVKFSDSRGDFVSTMSDKHLALWAADGRDGRPGVVFQTIHVFGMTFKDLLASFPGPYPFINIDVEGINFELFKSLCEIGIRELGVDLLCVEYQERIIDIESWAAVAGYERYHKTSENVLLQRRR